MSEFFCVKIWIKIRKMAFFGLFPMKKLIFNLNYLIFFER